MPGGGNKSSNSFSSSHQCTAAYCTLHSYILHRCTVKCALLYNAHLHNAQCTAVENRIQPSETAQRTPPRCISIYATLDWTAVCTTLIVFTFSRLHLFFIVSTYSSISTPEHCTVNTVYCALARSICNVLLHCVHSSVQVQFQHYCCALSSQYVPIHSSTLPSQVHW